MAQKTKRKRKHRGTAAGTIEARGRTSRAPTSGGIKKTAAERREERLDRPPTWRGAVNRAAIAAVVFAVIAALQLDAQLLDRSQELGRLVAGIDDQRLVGAVAAEQEAVLHHGPDGEHANVHTRAPGYCCLRLWRRS